MRSIVTVNHESEESWLRLTDEYAYVVESVVVSVLPFTNQFSLATSLATSENTIFSAFSVGKS